MRVTCADGSIHTSSVLIGADGVGSMIRKLAFPERPTLVYDEVSWYDLGLITLTRPHSIIYHCIIDAVDPVIACLSTFDIFITPFAGEPHCTISDSLTIRRPAHCTQT